MSFNHQNYIHFFAGIEWVNGATCSLIYDLHREKAYEIPSLLGEVFADYQGKTIQDIKEQFNHEYDEGINLYLNELYELDFIFFSNEKDAFIPNDYSNWDYPLEIMNAVIELPTSPHNYDVSSALAQLDELGCHHIQLRLVESGAYDFAYFEALGNELALSRINTIELYLPHSLLENIQQWDVLLNRLLRFQQIIFHSAQKNETLKTMTERGKDRIFTTKQVLDYSHKDLVSKDQMTYNILYFAEAKNRNTGLNRKVTIDKEGNIKNYLSHELYFGNINDLSLKAVINSEDFQKKWMIKKDQIEHCNVCQYRYACTFNTDLKEVDGVYHKVDDCLFDPYTNQWKKNESIDS